jgi:hypothetical protein
MVDRRITCPAMDPAGVATSDRTASPADGSFREGRTAMVAESEVGRTSPASVEPADLDLTLAEVKHLWSFLDGSIMNVDTRHHLWRSWGFCPRHTWCSAVADCAYRLCPRSTVVLYEDLTQRAAATLGRPAIRTATRLNRIRPRDTCFTCDYVAYASGDPTYSRRQQRVNRRQKFNELLLEAEPVWWARSCPICLGGDGPICRLHLLDAGAHTPASVAEALDDAARQLDDIARRLAVFGKSMTWHGPVADARQRASWIEALGWFAGWQYPAAAAIAARADDRGNAGDPPV